MLSAPHAGQRKATGTLRLEQRLYYLLRELMLRFSHRESLFKEFFADKLSATLSCFTALCHGLFVELDPDPECFRLVEELLLKQLAKAAVDAPTDVSVSG